MSRDRVAAMQEWLAGSEPEPICDPDLPIIDPHHHLWDRGGHTYLAGELLDDLTGGHRILGTCYVECLSHYRDHGPAELRPVGETEFVVGQTPDPIATDDDTIHPCAGIAAFADLALGPDVAPVLDAHQHASDGRLRSIRYSCAWDASKDIHSAYSTRAHMLSDDAVRQGLRQLGEYGLLFEAWVYFHQLNELTNAVDACPDTTFILNHMGGPIGIGPYKEQRETVFRQWRTALARLAERPNVAVKIGGLGMALAGFGFRGHDRPPSSDTLAAAWTPYVETCLALFGSDRAMLESNYPVDQSSGIYRTIWNALKKTTAHLPLPDRRAVSFDNANRLYRLNLTA